MPKGASNIFKTRPRMVSERLFSENILIFCLMAMGFTEYKSPLIGTGLAGRQSHGK